MTVKMIWWELLCRNLTTWLNTKNCRISFTMQCLYYFTDFSMTSWLTENSVVDTGIIQDVFVTQLLHTLGVSDYMKEAQCNKHQPPFNITSNNGWNVDSKLTNVTFTKSKM
jgi:hypothetical protein